VKILITLLVTLSVIGCAATPVSAPKTSVKQRFETAISRTILKEVRDTLPSLEGAARVSFLKEKSHQLESHVNQNLITKNSRLEQQLLEYMASAEDSRYYSRNYLVTLQSMTSLDWSLSTYEQKLTEELNRIDQTIILLANPSLDPGFNLPDHMEKIGATGAYPNDSFEGRQDYLDSLSQTMIEMQIDWYGVLSVYEPSQLGIIGEEGGDRTFDYDASGLSINLDRVSDLPFFELKSIAAFYGYPGLQAMTARNPDSLRSHIDLPAYNLGWAGYILDLIGVRDTQATLNYLYFSRLIAGLAQADLKINTGAWTRDQALLQIGQSTPYSRHRISLMLNQVTKKPGYYLAALAGKLVIVELHNRCLLKARNCEEEFNQVIVDFGPVPFDLLQSRLGLD